MWYHVTSIAGDTPVTPLYSNKKVMTLVWHMGVSSDHILQHRIRYPVYLGLPTESHLQSRQSYPQSSISCPVRVSHRVPSPPVQSRFPTESHLLAGQCYPQRPISSPVSVTHRVPSPVSSGLPTESHLLSSQGYPQSPISCPVRVSYTHLLSSQCYHRVPSPVQSGFPQSLISCPARVSHRIPSPVLSGFPTEFHLLSTQGFPQSSISWFPTLISCPVTDSSHILQPPVPLVFPTDSSLSS